MKCFLSFLLVLVLFCGMMPGSFAAREEASAAADTLYQLGLFNGKGTDANGKPIYALDDVPTRHEAVTMLVRLLGKEAEAKAGNWTTPFTDVDDWAKPYVGYAYANGLTTGTGATTFGGKATITATQYLTFVLRALGYTSGTDFQWDKAWELSDAIGLTSGEYNAETDAFLRSDIALISESALSARLKGSNVMLLRKLYNQKSAANYASKAKTIQVSKLGLPEAIGNTTLTYDEAYALLGKDPAVIADAVKTVGDVIQYLIAANFGAYSPSEFTPWYKADEQAWGFDPPGAEQLRQNYNCCCGGFANMGLYLLEGDYEEAGIIRWLGGGNHTINYVKTNGKYYVFDLTNYHAGNFNGPITVLDRLEDYYDQMPADDYPKDEVTNLVALKDADVSYPSSGDWKKGKLVFPTETKDHILQIYQKDASASVSFNDVRIDIPMWNTDRLDIPASNTKYDTYETLKAKYMNADITLLFSNGFSVQEGSKFQTGRGDRQITVRADDHAIANYTAKSSDPSICDVHVDANGILTLMPKQSGSCTLYITYQGQTTEFYYQTAF